MPPRRVPPCPNCRSDRTTEALSVPDWAYCPACGHLWPLGLEFLDDAGDRLDSATRLDPHDGEPPDS